MTDLYDLYRLDSPAGQGTKDWAIKVTAANEITERHGKTGSKLRTRAIKLDSGVDARSELLQRVNQKLSEGYSKIGKARIDDKGNLTIAQDIEQQTWSLSELDEVELKAALKSLVDDIVVYSFDTGFNEMPISADYDENLKGAIISCDGLLPTGGWQILSDAGLTFMSGGKVMGGGTIDYSLQLLLLLGLSKRLPDGSVTAVASKGQTDRDLMPSKRGLPADFVEGLELPRSYVREVAQAIGIIAKPVQILSQEAVSTPTAICF
ncbi:MAG: hypothetical protein CMH23_02600 [Methylophaga sp.]|jgi:predicted DNA-binding WGR domain protein|uniref:hypothetical protein n=1 Tax=Methylophaga sp. TaxID=2024840 RepID=UPI000C970922|nr:hypothetical protein [Methylophaga sp.]MBN45342.1 hypothetical protein [Methylophaga sp.]|tara:strand:- start:79989 stop:80780 length:792 start_codon:yes stop_codon:yes gene_type:complete